MFSFICKPEPFVLEFLLIAISSQLVGAVRARPLWPGSPFPPTAPKLVLAARCPRVPPPGPFNGVTSCAPRDPRCSRVLPTVALGAALPDRCPGSRPARRCPVPWCPAVPVARWCPARGPAAAGRGGAGPRGGGAGAGAGRAHVTAAPLAAAGRGGAAQAAPGGGGHGRALRRAPLLLLRHRHRHRRDRERGRARGRAGHAQRPPGRRPGPARRRTGECRRGHREGTGAPCLRPAAPPGLRYDVRALPMTSAQ